MLGLEELGVHDNFFEVGGDSIKGAILINRLQELIGEYVYVVAIFDAPTVAQLADYLRRHYAPAVKRIIAREMAAREMVSTRVGYERLEVKDRSAPRVDRKWSPLVELQRGDGGRPLFFVHPVGGNVFCYAQLAHHLGREQSFYGLQSFGLAGGHAPLGDISDMAHHYIQALRQVQPEGPYLLGGWSMGGIIAFEMAQQLQRDGHEISLLALLDSHTPAAFAQYSEINDEELLLQFKSDMSALYGLGGPAFDSDQLNRLFQVFRTNVQAMMGYEPQRYPGRITFFRANERLADISLRSDRGLANIGRRWSRSAHSARRSLHNVKRTGRARYG